MSDSALTMAMDQDWKTEKKKTYGQGGSQGNDNPTTVNGYDKSEVVSAIQKAIRRGNEAEALYWAHELLDSNESYRMWRRLVVIAAEDVGMADPDMTHKIMVMKQAHDFGRESNIVFQAVMMLCRAPKNREADDASYLYFMRRKAGWKIPMPPEAVDGHTRRGRTELYRIAERNGITWEDAWNREFYFDVALLRGYVEIETDGEPEKYRKQLMTFLKLPYETYDIETATQPRMRTGRDVTKRDVLGDRRAQTGGVKISVAADTKTGEVDPHALLVQSFTNPETWYRVEIERSDQTGLMVLGCSCPAYQNNPNRQCKHMTAAMRSNGEPT